MKRTNTFDVVPQTKTDETILRRFLDASASLWNELNYARRQQFFDGESIWETDDFYKRYVGVLGGATTQSIIKRNTSAWKSFFALLDDHGNDASPPGYWGNEDSGRILRSFVRKDAYDIEWGRHSRIEIRIGQDLKDEFDMGYYERLRLEVRGNPHWRGEPGRLSLKSDEASNTFRAFQPVTVPDSVRDLPLAANAAALDVGANNLVACTTTTGRQYLYEGRALFEVFRKTTEEIARLRSKLPDDRESSKRIRRLYRTRTRRRDHAVAALVRSLVERLHQDGVDTVYVGDLSNIRETAWSATVNEKVHNFWAFRKFHHRIECVCEEYGIDVAVRSEAWSSQTCPRCGGVDTTTRQQDRFTCRCGFEGHADLVASRNFLEESTTRSMIARPMARPVRFQWDNHEWRSTRDAPVPNPNEQRTNP